MEILTMEQKNKFKEFMRVVKFTLLSVGAGVIQIGLFTLINEVFHWNYWVAYLPSLIASILFNFYANRKLTFNVSGGTARAMTLVFLFYLVFVPVSTVLGELSERAGVNEYIVLAVTMLLNFVLEYLYTRLFVYGKNCDNRK